MKKAMLFMIALLFSVSASAASLSLTGDAGNVGAVEVASGQFVTASGYGDAGTVDTYTVTADADTGMFLTATFNPYASLTILDVDSNNVIIQQVATLGVATYNWFATAGTLYEIIVDLGANAAANTSYDLRIETPIPAAAFLFAPALLGLFGLRRKSQAVAA